MGDITELFSTSSKVKTTPTKSYISSYSAVNGNENDTGITLSVSGGHSFAISFMGTASGTSVSSTFRLYSGATVLKTWSISTVGNQTVSADFSSNIFFNSSTSTVKLTVQSTSLVGTSVVNNGSLIEGVHVINSDIESFLTWSENMYINSLDWQFSGEQDQNSSSTIMSCNGPGGTQTTDSITAVTFTFGNIYINEVTWSCPFTTTYGRFNAFVAFDWDGKSLVVN